MKVKKYRITYSLEPEYENVVIYIWALSYEDVCAYAKEYRSESFSCEIVND